MSPQLAERKDVSCSGELTPVVRRKILKKFYKDFASDVKEKLTASFICGTNQGAME